MPHALINGARFYYQESGRGFPLIFTHGLGADHSMWINQIPVFKDRYRTVVWDVRGHGKSEIAENGYSVEQFVEDLYSLMRHLDIEKAHIAGLSMGGWISWSFALAHPDACASLVLSDSAGVMLFSEKEMEDIITIFEKTAHIAEKYGMEKLADVNISLMFARDFIKKNPAIIELVKKQIVESSGTGFARTIRGAFINLAKQQWESIRTRLAGITAPAIILAGDKDQLTPLNSQRALHEAIPGSKLEIIEGSGHVPPVEKPEIWNGIVLDFLGKVEG